VSFCGLIILKQDSIKRKNNNLTAGMGKESVHSMGAKKQFAKTLEKRRKLLSFLLGTKTRRILLFLILFLLIALALTHATLPVKISPQNLQ
jgi:hypothetical protein